MSDTGRAQGPATAHNDTKPITGFRRSTALPDPDTEFGARVRRRLHEERVIWLTAVAEDGTPQPNPVWFWWDGTSFLVYNWDRSRRLEHIRRNPRVSLHLNADAKGHDVLVVVGRAEVLSDAPPPHEVPGYRDKYAEAMVTLAGSAEAYAKSHAAAVRIHPERVRGR
ncbi:MULTISPECIES: TIGR03667 family PPOX class F420-dependent oxidoreductase [unclassified Streptomyces]|uniref:TIGR03667 family PPOX class F420-dependent oxidoreductase n=1 Tax=unclassified Streptomyces TaxID=2593676 RepID=UPI00331D0F64